ncbi:MAG: YbjN domain-containing protein [Bacteroidota bacterium]
MDNQTLLFQELEKVLGAKNVPYEFYPRSEEQPFPLLVAQFSLSEQLVFNISFIFIPTGLGAEGKTELLQVYTEIGSQKVTNPQIKRFLNSINSNTPLGSFGVNEEDGIYFRYMLMVPKKATPELYGTFEDFIQLFLFTVSHFGPTLDQLNQGIITAAAALKQLQSE